MWESSCSSLSVVYELFQLLLSGANPNKSWRKTVCYNFNLYSKAVHILKGTGYKNIQTNKESKPVTLTDLIEVVGVCDLVVKVLKEPDTVVSAENDPIKDGLCGVWMWTFGVYSQASTSSFQPNKQTSWWPAGAQWHCLVKKYQSLKWSQLKIHPVKFHISAQ